jgi:protein-disulfide isomerase
LGLDERRFAKELASGVWAPRVRRDFRTGVRAGVNGTPTFFINGRRYDGPWSDPALFIGVLSSVAEQAEHRAER